MSVEVTQMRGYGMDAFKATDEELIAFFKDHEAAVRKAEAEEVLDYIASGETDLQAEFFDYENEDGNAVGLNALVAQVITIETGLWFDFFIGDIDDNNNAIMFPECFPWCYSRRDMTTSVEELDEIINRYMNCFESVKDREPGVCVIQWIG